MGSGVAVPYCRINTGFVNQRCLLARRSTQQQLSALNLGEQFMK
jgi:hypothetical protein